MTNTATLNTSNKNTINYAGKREREREKRREEKIILYYTGIKI